MALLSLVGSSLGKELHPEKESGRRSLPKDLLSFKSSMRQACLAILVMLEDMLTVLYRGKHFGGYVQGRWHDHPTHKTDRSHVRQACKHDPRDSANNLR